MLTKIFQQLSKNDADIAGGKGASLGEMTSTGIPVPPGFVVLSDAFERFLEETDLNVEVDAILETVDNQKMHTVEQASEKIQVLILEAKMPEDIEKEILESYNKLFYKDKENLLARRSDNEGWVAVRSSATAEDGAEAAWAGQLNSYLNTTENSLLRNVQKCWASLFTPRAIFYRFEKGLHNTHISVAVVVQKMVQSEKSGIAFSVHPVTEDYNQLIIEAGFGLGEAIVSGSITPDSYVVEKDPRKIIDINISTQTRGLFQKIGGGNEWRDIAEPQASEQVLDEKEILELSELIMKIENHYGFPCDIEWAQEDRKFYITQSRPITTLSSKNRTNKENDIFSEVAAKNWYVDWDANLPLTSLSFTLNAYFTKIPELFDARVTDILVVSRKNRMVGYLDKEDHDRFAKSLLPRVDSMEKATQWANSFKAIADKITEEIKTFTPDKLLQDFEYCMDLFDEYGAWQISTKAVYNVLPADFDHRIAEILQDSRAYSEKFYKELGIFIDLVSYIAAKEGYSAEAVSSLTREESLDYIKNGKLPSHEELEKRYECCALYLHRERMTHIFSCEEVNGLEQMWREEQSDGEVRGVAAYGGKAIGKCKIVYDFENVSLESGEVLVTVMTDPNFVPLMKKASAIITDGGGMLCHAAIVSRELKTPCIIGTKIATQVLKDGDLVEVDADNGVVRILEKAKKDPLEDVDQWTLWGRWKFPMFSNIPYNSYKDSPVFKKLNMPEGFTANAINIDGYVYAFKKDHEIFNRFIGEKFRNDHAWFDNFFHLCEETFVAANKLKKDEDIVSSMKALTDIGCLTMVIHFCDKALESVVSEVAESSAMSSDEFSKLLVPNRPTYVMQYKNALRTLRKENIQEFLDKFSWIGGSYLNGERLTEKDIEKEMYDLPEKEEGATIDQINLADKIKSQISILQNLIYYRSINAELVNKIINSQWGSLDELAIKYGYTRNDFNVITPKEIIKLAQFGMLPENFQKRLDDGGLERNGIIYSSGKLHLLFGKELEEKLKVFEPVSSDEGSDIKGTPAFKGKAKGIAKIVENAKDLEKIEEGDIIISPETMPDYIVGMKKAAAFVTDQGGITSHAAIVARELRKPCIIGTKIATQVLKDGDLVEVDADNGVVRILEKSGYGEKKLSQQKHERVFGGPEMPYLVSDIITDIYVLKYQFITIYKDSIWTCYMPKEMKEKTLKEGIELYGSKKNYEAYREEYLKFIESYDSMFHQMFSEGKSINPENFEAIIELFKKAESYYTQTQYFYTDSVSLDNKLDSDFGNLKEKGRTLLNKQYFSDDNYLGRVLGIVSKETNIDEKNLYDYSWREIKKMLAGKKDQKVEEKNAYITFPKDGGKQTLSNDEAMDMIDDFLIHHYQDVKKLKGSIANKGKVIGKAYVLDQGYDHENIVAFIEKMEKGDVLVTETTSPEIMMACQKASAIVTNQGGMMSHAAIVSRELGIPCIVGVEGATAIINDNDLIEVDAEHGVVHILESRKEDGGEGNSDQGKSGIDSQIKPSSDIGTNKVVFSKYMSREHSMFYACVWNEANVKMFDKFVRDTNIENIIFSLNDRGVLDVYYDLKELKDIFERIVEKIAENPEILDEIIDDFYFQWKKMLPYIENEKAVESLEELKEYWKNWKSWWAAMAYVFVLPDQKNLPEALKEKALRVRVENQEYSDEGDRPFLNFISAKYPQHREIARLMTPEEVFNIEKLTQEELALIKKREEGISLVTLRGDAALVPNDGIENFLEKQNAVFERISNFENDIIKGEKASLGFFKGRVRLVLSKKDLEKVEEGEVMVTYATSPDYVPSMKKAGAIVTDEGEVVCHAAIVARELKIPCITGTKIATQVLKDGDLVEIDADNGVVRILERVGENILDKIKKHKLAKEIDYPATAIIYFESGHNGYVDNPYFKKLGVSNFPTFVATQIEKYENFVEKNEAIISDKKSIEYIIKESYAVIKKYKPEIERLERVNYGNLDKKDVIEELRLIDKILTEIYHVFVFYTSEHFKTEDEILLRSLPEVRMKLSDFVGEVQEICGKLLYRIKSIYKNIDSRAFDFTTFEEIIHFIEGAISKTEFEKFVGRPIAYVGIKDKLTILKGDEAFDIREYCRAADENNKILETTRDNIYGIIAHKGIVKGEIIKIFADDYGDYDEKLKDKKDFILVAPMTRPEVMPYLKMP